MKRFKNIIIAAAVTSSLIVMPISAAPDVEAIKKEKEQTQQMINSTNVQLKELLTEFEMLRSDIRNQEEEIKKADEDLKAAQEKEKKQYDEMKIRIKYMYEKGEGSEVTALLGAESFGDMINQAEYIQNVHTYDRKMLDELVKVKEEVASLKSSLEDEKAQMESMAVVLAEEEKSLQSTLSDMRSKMADFDAQLEEAKRQAEEEAKRIAEEAARKEAEQAQNSQNSSTNNKPSKPAEKPSKPEETSKPKPEEKPSKPKPEEKPSKPEPEEPSKPSNASKGQQIANTGLKYVGNPYVYGGNSLTEGIDCSGFTKQIHALCGISGVPRSSAAQRTGGKAVSGGLANALPGDIICYSGHVALYLGGGKIVHASSPEVGIITGTATYKPILAIRRYW